jgi:Trypsin-like peptidase domain
MAPKLSISEQLTYSTVRIECRLRNGATATGSGFFFRCVDDGKLHVPVIVTNRHVVAGSVTGRFHMHQKDSEGNPIPGRHEGYTLNDFETRWIGHPDPRVDLCVMPIAPLTAEIQQQGHSPFYIGLDKNLLLNQAEMDDLTALEDVVMIGYPNGIWDSVNNLPIIRKGITATHPAVNYEGRTEFLIDAACFPGSSGSPVFLFNLSSFTTKSGGTQIGGSRIKLMGILYAGPQYTTEGEVKVVSVPTQQRVVAVSSIPNNLGYVIKAERLRDFDAMFPASGAAV